MCVCYSRLRSCGLSITFLYATFVERFVSAVHNSVSFLFVRQNVLFRRTFGRRKHIKSARINASPRLLRWSAVNSVGIETTARRAHTRVHTPCCFMQKLRVRLVLWTCDMFVQGPYFLPRFVTPIYQGRSTSARNYFCIVSRYDWMCHEGSVE